MTGVFHFMAISFGSFLTGAQVRIGDRVLSTETPSTRWLAAREFCATRAAFLGVTMPLSQIAAEVADPGSLCSRLLQDRRLSSRFDPARGRGDRGARGRARICVDTTEDGARFSDANTRSGTRSSFSSARPADVLEIGEKAALERYIRSGGGFVGIHSASDTEYGWPWYGRLVGAWFAGHPQIQRATVHIADPNHPSTKGLPAAWERTDEWYNFRSNRRGAVQVLATLDEATYSGAQMGAPTTRSSGAKTSTVVAAGIPQWAIPRNPDARAAVSTSSVGRDRKHRGCLRRLCRPRRRRDPKRER